MRLHKVVLLQKAAEGEAVVSQVRRPRERVPKKPARPLKQLRHPNTVCSGPFLSVIGRGYGKDERREVQDSRF